jgi:hypothetical protein
MVAEGDFVPTSTLRLPIIGNTASVALACGLLACLFVPSTTELFRDYLGDPGLPQKSPTWLVDLLSWKPSRFWAITTAGTFFLAVMDLLSASPSAFLYFQF